MSRHEGVSCDSCLKANFRGRRYKCLICYDYDLCDTCFDTGANNTRHTADHPVQCILTRSDFDLFYSGEAITNVDQPQAYTCPYCSKMGFTDATLQEHVAAEHGDTSSEVICPICAAMPGGDPNFMTDDFAGHLTLEHRTGGTRDLISLLDDPASGTGGPGHTGSGNIGGSNATRHSGRRISHSSHLPGGGRGGQSSRPRRSNMHFSIFSTPGFSSSLSPSSSSRDPVDPIAELLSQLSGVRRSATNVTGSVSTGGAVNSTSSQLQQLQMHLQLERQQFTTVRQQLERLPRRPNQSQTTSLREAAAVAAAAAAAAAGSSSSSVAASAAAAAAVNSNFGYSLLMNPNGNANNATQPQASAPPVPSPPSNFLLEGLLEELTLQANNEQNVTDRYNFADNLLVGTMNCVNDNESESEKEIEIIMKPMHQQQISQQEQDLQVENDRVVDNVSPLAANTVDSSPNNNARQQQTRVLRGRARSDGHNNAMRRADANKATDDNKGNGNLQGKKNNNGGSSNDSGGNLGDGSGGSNVGLAS